MQIKVETRKPEKLDDEPSVKRLMLKVSALRIVYWCVAVIVVTLAIILILITISGEKV